MATVKGFKGIRYNPELIEDFSKVLAPPYDVISPEEQEALYEKDPHNVIRLDLPKGEGDSRYENAASAFRAWMEEKILIQDEEPSIYPYHQQFEWEGRTLTRKGFIAAVRIEDFSTKKILPHERTFPKHKKDRLKLTEACGANMSPVFSVYSDPDGVVESAIDEKIKGDPILDASIENGVGNRMWQVSDPELLSFIAERMEDKSFLIADGHHRYETALEYRNIHAGAGGEEAPFDYVMMFLSRGEDEGLIINPTHRVAAHLNGTDLAGLLSKLEADFKVTKMPLKEAVSGLGYEEIAVVGKDREFAYRLSPRSSSGKPLDSLAVMRLHTEVLGRHLDEEKAGIVYTKFLDEALSLVHEGDKEIAFILPELRAADIFGVVMTGDRMPHKTTYFYPKILSGLVFNPLW